MTKTTLALVTILFGVICGSRLVDNRLLRLSSSSSYTGPYKTIADTMNMNSLNDKSDGDKTSKAARDLPCFSDLNINNDLPARQCNDNIVNSILKNPTNNYLTYDNNDNDVNDDSDDDSIHNAFNSYQSVEDFDSTPEVESFITKKKISPQQSRLNIFPVANYKDFYDDLIMETAKEEMKKRNGNSLVAAHGSPPPRGCDCKIRNDLVDLGQQHFPRYLLNAVCHSEHSRNDLAPKCWSGSVCRPLEYKVKVLTFRTLMDNTQKDPTLAWLPDDLRQIWKFKTVTVTAGCFCS